MAIPPNRMACSWKIDVCVMTSTCKQLPTKVVAFFNHLLKVVILPLSAKVE